MCHPQAQAKNGGGLSSSSMLQVVFFMFFPGGGKEYEKEIPWEKMTYINVYSEYV